MSINIPPPSQPKEPFHHRNGSDELDVFEAARYFAGATENFNGTYKNMSGESRVFGNNMQKYCMRPMGRMSLDMPNRKGNSLPLQAMLMENPMLVNNEKKSKQPSSPGGKLAHFLNSLFNQTSSKKSKSKAKTKTTKEEDESASGWRRKRRSSISHFRSGNSNSFSTTTATTMSDSKSPFSTSRSSGFRTPPTYIAHTPTKTPSYRDHPRSYSHEKHPPSQITKLPTNGTLNKIENYNTKSDLSEKKMSSGNRFTEKIQIFDEKQEEYHPYKYVSREDIKEFKSFIDKDDGDSDSSSDLFELTNCDLGYYPSGLPVYETTHMDSIKRGVPISS
ncbi:hypothetical protein L2E82_08637 [Cichorium intybus]|uniref:Uncharacterized protein n=1 Tax=Cichorium intybus TaxID=13427 RepID=A0ACB9G7Q7_CICIN|nr:hypothetical protein L2E82_08637 [Cichorium intybus]